MPLDADLIVRPVFDRRGSFAPASGIAANIVLLRKSAGTQVAQRGDLVFDFIDALLEQPWAHRQTFCLLFQKISIGWKHENGPIVTDSLNRLSANESRHTANQFRRRGIPQPGRTPGSVAGEDF